jgi:hypothetical protein
MRSIYLPGVEKRGSVYYFVLFLATILQLSFDSTHGSRARHTDTPRWAL